MLRPSDVEGLAALIGRHRLRGARAVGGAVRVLCCYEAGYEGFWLARWLALELSVETVVLDPASLPVDRKAKQRKTDRIDARRMVRALVAHDRGDTTALRRVRVPSVEQEDNRRLLRERRCLVKERTSLCNRIGGLLKLHGIFDLHPPRARVRGQARRGADGVMARRCRRARREVERSGRASRPGGASDRRGRGRARRGGAVREDALDGGCAGGRRGAGLGEDRGAGPAQGDRRQRRDAAGPRGVLARLPQPPASWPAGPASRRRRGPAGRFGATRGSAATARAGSAPS